MSGHIFTCKHGRHGNEPCDECLIHWSEHVIRSAHETIAKHEAKIVALRAAILSQANVNDVASQPSIEKNKSP